MQITTMFVSINHRFFFHTYTCFQTKLVRQSSSKQANDTFKHASALAFAQAELQEGEFVHTLLASEHRLVEKLDELKSEG